MALFQLFEPQAAGSYARTRFMPVYRPVVWTFGSTAYPSLTFPSAIVSIRKPTTSELVTYTNLGPDMLLVEHNLTGYNFYFAGSKVSISGGTPYDGEWRIMQKLTPNLMAIDATWSEDWSNGGEITIVLGNFTVYAKVRAWIDQGNGIAANDGVTFALKPIYVDSVPQGTKRAVFRMDVRDYLARSFDDAKKLVTTSTTGLVNADGYVAMSYTVEAYEAYDVVSADNVITFTRNTNDVLTPPAETCVNVVQPYHLARRDGTVPFDWQDSMADYHALNDERRFLTHIDNVNDQNKAVPVRTGDAFYLAWLNVVPGRYAMRITYLDSSYQSLGLQDIGGGQSVGLSNICNVGPKVLTIPTGTRYYHAQLIDRGTGGIVSSRFYFEVVACKGVNKRWYYLNKMGGIDAFTFEGDERRNTTVKRSIIDKPSMPTQFGNWEWQRRVWRTEPQRKYTLTSGYLLPATLRTIAEDMFESPNIFTEIRENWWTTVIPLTTEVPGDSDSGRAERFVVQYQLGVDNMTQRT